MKPTIFYKQLSALLAAVCLLVGCDDSSNEDGKYSTVKLNTYVVCYQTTILSLDADVRDGNLIYLFENIPGMGEGRLYAFNDEHKREFKALSEKYGDTGFKNDYLMMPPVRREFMAMPFTKVEIVSDSDFDAQHPAGASLSDIARFKTITPYPFIRSGHTETFDWESYPGYEDFKGLFYNTITDDILHILDAMYVYPVDKLASELTTDDLTLLGRGECGWVHYGKINTDPFAVLEFEQEPDISKTHNFVVTLTDEDGNRYQSQAFAMQWK